MVASNGPKSVGPLSSAKISTVQRSVTGLEMKFSTKRFLLVNGFALLMPLGIATAQDADGQRDSTKFTQSGSNQTDYRVEYGGGGGGLWGGGGRHASTAQEGMARGMSDVIRARGQASVDVAKAATESERARRAYQENRNFAVSSFVENRAIRDEYRANADNTFYKSKEKLATYVESRRLQPLTRSEFYQGTGEINWPIGLLHPHDEKGRKEVEALFTKRAAEGSLTPAEYVRLNELLNYWVNHTGSHRDTYSSSDTKDAARFLRRLQVNVKADFQ
jgi:hypothetical protein